MVCDNLKSCVTATCRYEPGISRTYQEQAGHYGAAILLARVQPELRAGFEVPSDLAAKAKSGGLSKTEEEPVTDGKRHFDGTLLSRCCRQNIYDLRGYLPKGVPILL